MDRCAACAVVMHRDCRRTLGRCPTVGCAAPDPPTQVAPEPPCPAPPARRLGQALPLRARPAVRSAGGHPPWQWAVIGASVAVVAAVGSVFIWPDTPYWPYILLVGVPYLAGLGLLCEWWVRSFGVRPAGGSLLARVAMRALLMVVLGALFALPWSSASLILAPAVATVTVLIFLSLVGDPFSE